MHELAITRNIVAIVGDAAQGRRVTRGTLEIGKLSGVMAGAGAFCFGVVGAGPPARRASAEECGAATLFAPCRCGSRSCERVAGEELNIKAIEVEEAA